jgi:hypothetical protein
VNASCRPPDPGGSALAPAVELDDVVPVWLAGVASEEPEPVAVDGAGVVELECVGVEIEDFDLCVCE